MQIQQDHFISGMPRGAVYGDALYRLAKHLGYDITAEYYVNDAGNQMENLLGLSAVRRTFKHIKRRGWYLSGVTIAESIYRLAEEAIQKFGKDILTDESRQKELALWAKDDVMEIIKKDLADTNIAGTFTFVYESSLYDDWDRVMAKMGDGIYKKDE